MATPTLEISGLIYLYLGYLVREGVRDKTQYLMEEIVEHKL